MLASVLRGVISQRLVPTADGEGRTAILEVLRTTGRVQDTIKDGDVHALPDIIAEGSYYGMQSFDQALYAAVKDGRVTMETALEYATRPHDFKLLVAGEGRTGTSMEDVQQEPEKPAEEKASTLPPPAPARVPEIPGL